MRDLCAVSLVTARAEAIEIVTFESALDELELTDAQPTMILSATREYR